ncbi:MAG: hypothetical protein WC436_03155 [Candidatus Babeliales bacterium]
MKNKIKYYFLFFIFLISNLNIVCSLQAESDQVSFGTVSKRRFDIITIKTIYGDCSIKTNTQDNVLLEIINSNIFQRLKYIHQYGITHFVRPDAVYIRPHNDYTRYEHSICAMVIARLFGLPLEEQIATLIHDIKHTAFSHVGDILFKVEGTNLSYHDFNLEKFLVKHGIAAILERYYISINDILPEIIGYRSLKKPTPMLCTDRIEYTIHGAYIAGLLNKEDIFQIISNLKYDHNQEIWYFENQEIALKFATASMDITEQNSGAAWNTIIYQIMSNILQKAIVSEIIFRKSIKYKLFDNEIWNILNNCKDEYIERSMFLLKNHQNLYTEITTFNKDTTIISNIKTVCRCVDPLILDNSGELKKLSELDQEFAIKFLNLKKTMEEDGWNIEFTLPVTQQTFQGC